MAKSLDQVDTERQLEANEGREVPSEDLEIAFRMGVQLMADGGLDMLRKAINESTDPAVVIGQFLAQLMGQMAESLRDEIELDPAVFLAKGGWLDLMLDYIEPKLGYPEEFSDQIYAEVLEIVKAGAMGSGAPNNVMEMGQEGAMPQQPEMPNAPNAGVPAMPGGV